MSPASRGLLPGLFLALAAAFGVLAVNRVWLLPSLDETGVRYLLATPQLAAGTAPSVPIAPWDAAAATTGLDGVGTLMPMLMAVTTEEGTRAHVAALWVLCGAAALVVLALSWVAGGAGGLPAALLAAALVALAPCTLDAATAVDPALLLAALVALLAGAMTYQPRWSALHGVLGAAAWLAHPAGVGAVAAAVVGAAASRPPRAGERGEGRAPVRPLALRAGLAALPAAALLAAGARWPLLSPPTATPSPASLLAGLHGLLAAAAPRGRPGEGWWGPSAGAALLTALGALVLAEARATPAPPPDPHWTDPAAADLLALRLRRAAGIAAPGALLGTAWSGGATGGWLPAAHLLLVLAAVAGVRWAGRGRRARGAARGGTPKGALRWVPVVLLAVWGGAAGWASRARALELRAEGRGVTARVWVASPVVRWLDNSARPYAEIYATEPALVLVQSGRAARSLPPAEGVVTAERFAARFAAHPGAVVLTGADASDARADALARSLGLREVVRSPEGRVLVPAGPER